MKGKLFAVSITLVTVLSILSMTLRPGQKDEPVSEMQVRSSLNKSIPLLERSAYLFGKRNKFGCAGCHHNCLTALVENMAQAKGINTVDSLRQNNEKLLAFTMTTGTNTNLPDDMAPSRYATAYLMVALAAAGYPPDASTDIGVDFLLFNAMPDGGLRGDHLRIPEEAGDFHLVAMAIRAVRFYASAAKTDSANLFISRAANWLLRHQPNELTQESAFRLLGLKWADAAADSTMKQITAELVSQQKADGGWSQLPTMKSEAYSTGQVLYALKESGMITVSDPAFQRGIRYLLNTQQPGGAWVMETRAMAVQPFFNAGFPPEDDSQFIDAAATNWATLAVLEMLPDKTE